jgi:hypothetical protein
MCCLTRRSAHHNSDIHCLTRRSAHHTNHVLPHSAICTPYACAASLGDLHIILTCAASLGDLHIIIATYTASLGVCAVHDWVSVNKSDRPTLPHSAICAVDTHTKSNVTEINKTKTGEEAKYLISKLLREKGKNIHSIPKTSQDK